ncbi:DUF3040 domain-containing protein [Lentzea sp. NBRC 102530]|uniref:DUF3040 domain-containing protein n=1 Tax=Lentzea sp. NBRC 102530 TaxID=3032201 RepID=UPI0024A44207|nr:DUF3040 domain-containing protein [Lentzea sp. NBRC 102530]GLY47271.1 hypothetical protein Lesp01_09270 [Lentzea sp. NBRC 102530]
MLSESERRTLGEIEHALSTEDPKLAETLQGTEMPAARERGRHAYAVLLALTASMGLLALALGHLTGVVACALVAGWTWGSWRLRRDRTTG